MIKSVRFKNFRVLRDTTLPLGRFTLIVGPNGSGKTTALKALQRCSGASFSYAPYVAAGIDKPNPIELEITWGQPNEDYRTLIRVDSFNKHECTTVDDHGKHVITGGGFEPLRSIGWYRTYCLNADRIAQAVAIQPDARLTPDGGNLAAVLDHMRDHAPERFDHIAQDLVRWLPEFDGIQFTTPAAGLRSFSLETKGGRKAIRAEDLSQGTLLALGILTVAHENELPTIIGFEEPDHGLHPRLLRDVRDALYRLSHPESCGETRDPVQVVVTTHSPHFLDLFKDHPEEIVLANKTDLEATFERLVDRPDVDEIISSAPLGDVWYSGVLGGVPAEG